MAFTSTFEVIGEVSSVTQIRAINSNLKDSGFYRVLTLKETRAGLLNRYYPIFFESKKANCGDFAYIDMFGMGDTVIVRGELRINTENQIELLGKTLRNFHKQ